MKLNPFDALDVFETPNARVTGAGSDGRKAVSAETAAA